MSDQHRLVVTGDHLVGSNKPEAVSPSAPYPSVRGRGQVPANPDAASNDVSVKDMVKNINAKTPT